MVAEGFYIAQNGHVIESAIITKQKKSISMYTSGYNQPKSLHFEKNNNMAAIFRISDRQQFA